MSLLLIDMDGTLREPLSGQQYFQYPKDQRISDRSQPYRSTITQTIVMEREIGTLMRWLS